VKELRTAIQAARKLYHAGGGSVLDILLRSYNDSPESLADELSKNAGVMAIFNAHDLSFAYTSGFTPEVARDLGCVPLRLREDTAVRLALADPWDEEIVRLASANLGMVPLLLAVPAALLNQLLGIDGQQVVSVGSHERSGATSLIPMLNKEETPSLIDSPVINFVDAAIQAAHTSGASDVHFECGRYGIDVRLRQDGVMTQFAHMDEVHRAEEVISRIKVLAQLDITERRTPQDGRFRFAISDINVDLRVSIMPSLHGEDAVLRLLDKAQLRSRAKDVSLDLLGFSISSAELIRNLAQLPSGMLLVTGPTGSGKTTTVYAILSEINTGIEKIITIEDPVEYELVGVLQIPVNERKGLTFAKGLRSILRHDPDRILVGEIRDSETAEIAIQSALTGHQVFTTVHANSIFDVTGRFKHFGLDMFGFMSALNGVIVQRLVRRVCPHCIGSRKLNEWETRWLSTWGLSTDEVPSPRGCSECKGTGYRGRMVIAEVHQIDDHLRDMIMKARPISELRAHVSASRVTSLSEQAAHLVLAGITTAEEIRRVVGQ